MSRRFDSFNDSLNSLLDWSIVPLIVLAAISCLLAVGCTSSFQGDETVKIGEVSYSRKSGGIGSTTWTWNQKPTGGSDEKPSIAPTQEPSN